MSKASLTFIQAQVAFPLALVMASATAIESDTSSKDTIDISLRYPISDRRSNFFTESTSSSIDFKDPKAIQKKIEYDPKTNQYIIYEKIGNNYFRTPQTMTFDEYVNFKNKQLEQQYFEMRSKARDLAERKSPSPPLYDGPELYDKGFGQKPKIEIKPQGNVEVTLGAISQKIDNPVLPLPQRKQTNFDFDMNINMSLTGQIGDYMKLNTNFNTKATFNFENQVKLGYKGKEDNIIQEVSAGNVSLPLRSSLIRGNQSLFGIKTQLKFGRLLVTNILSQQKSKSESIRIEGGSQTKNFEIKADEYEENKHFFFAHSFRENYEPSLSRLPVVTSIANINRIEVWVTNTNRQTIDVREVVALADLGEKHRLNKPEYFNPTGPENASNNSNTLYKTLTATGNNILLRNPATAITLLENQLHLRAVEDYERTSARKLATSEYTFNPLLGYISLNQSLKPNEVLGVAIEYTINGEVFKVGEFADGVTPNTDTSNVRDKVLILKMLKATSIRTNLPIWDLMMKNIYPLNAYQISPENFMLDVYYRDPGGGMKRYLPDGGDISGQQLIKVLELDNTNTQLDPQPDGRFDFIENITINSRTGKVIFPVLEPFGDYLRKKINNDKVAQKYVYDILYDSTKFKAQQFPEYNRFVLKGSYKSSNSSEIKLGGFNLPPGSVIVTSGGYTLRENIDYEINYSLGTVRIINDGVMNSGVPIDIKFENNILFGVVNRSLVGTRLDYEINKNFTLGATHMRLSEKPFTQKVNMGDDPIKNNIIGFDLNYFTESKGLTRFINKITAQDIQSPSKISISGEFAKFIPGSAKGINLGKEPTIYIDDFEGTSVNYDLKFPFNAWQLSSAPKGMTNTYGAELYPEAALNNDLKYGYNRAKLSWYQIDNVFYNSRNNPLSNNKQEQEGVYTRLYYEKQVFPNRQNENLQNAPLYTFDLTFNPKERGPYNFETTGEPGISAGLDFSGRLKEPRSRWGGIMRTIETANDFEAANIEFIQFWFLDPFLKNQNAQSGSLYIHLGTISEDILKDSRKQYENGLPRPGVDTKLDTSVWGVTPRISNAITNAFDANPEVIKNQDVGMDGLNDDAERSFYQTYLNQLRGILSPEAYSTFENDPSNDNYKYALDKSFSSNDGILTRYENFNGTQGNSSNNADDVNRTTGNAKNTPDDEDLNRDNTLNETEEYFQYRLDVDPISLANSEFITDRVVVPISVNGVPDSAVWYQAQIPISAYNKKVGSIPDFRSIRYIRMVMTDFEEPVTLRMAEFSLVRNQWRRYTQNIGEPGESLPSDHGDNTTFNVSSISIEENSNRYPIPYAIPPGISREQTINGYYNALQNEQSLKVQVCDLQDGQARAVYKLSNIDLRLFKRLKLFTHAESLYTDRGQLMPLNDGDLTAFIRIGSDFTENYYEYEIPLKLTPQGSYNSNVDADRRIIWPEENEFNIKIDSLTLVKQLRNNQNTSLTKIFTITDEKGRKISIRGNPDIGQSAIIMLGIRNPKRIIGVNDHQDDGMSKCGEIWFNELRVGGLDEQGGYAALGRVDVQLGNLGNVTLTGNMHSIGFGDIEQKLAERSRDDYYQIDVAANVNLGKMLPEKVGLEIPVYANYSTAVSTPQYDPYEYDIKVKDKLAAIDADPHLTPTDKKIKKEEVKEMSQTVDQIKSVNISNMRKLRTNIERPAHVYDIENFDITYAYSEVNRSSPIIEDEVIKKHKFALGYNYSPKTSYWQPFKNLKNNHRMLKPIKEFNLNYKPNNISFRSDINRQFGTTLIRDIGNDGLVIDPTFDKFFTWDRYYSYKHNLTKNINFEIVATNRARIDEPFGYINTPEKKDSLRRNFWSFGRATTYNHSFNLNYNLPTQYIYFLDWLTVKARYNSTLGYTASSLAIPEWGNILDNSMNLQINGEVNFKALYQKIPGLKPYTTTEKRKTKEEFEQVHSRFIDNYDRFTKRINEQIIKIEKKEEEIEKAEKDTSLTKEDVKLLISQKKELKNQLRKIKEDRSKVNRPQNPTLDAVIRPLLLLQRGSITYDDKRSTVLPGYMPTSKIFGQDLNYNAPGIGFLFGQQKDTSWLSSIASKGWITKDTIFNYQFQQQRSKNLNARVVLEPIRDFRVDVNLTKQSNEIYTEFFKRASDNGPYQHLSAQTGGSYTISFLMIRTIFDKIDKNNFSSSFRNFESIRAEFSKMLSESNPNSNGQFINQDSIMVEGFYQGYGPYSKDVLIPALISAYTGKDVNKVRINPLKTFPLPNWRLTYNGIAKTKWGKKLFSSFNINHAYNSTFTVSNYSSDLNFLGTPGYDKDAQYFVPSALDTLSGNFYTLYYIPQIQITEQFVPFIGVDITWKNRLQTSFEYKKSRTLGLSLLDFQLAETRSSEFTGGLGYALAKFKLPFKIRGERVVLENDINLRFDISVRNDRTVNYRLNQNIAEPTSGAKTITFSPTIDYVVNKRLNLRIFFDYRKTTPATLASYPIRNSRGGVTLRFSLAP
ncbi:MAG: cell surface protein SprA [Chitinophagales bacterium]|nr:cell surface protein SprA [Chitinophagales bacterium]MCZ2394217.1 cell surface protein SprA [Chitinophagales bacterium]